MDTKVLEALSDTVSKLFDHIHVSFTDNDRNRRAPLDFIGTLAKNLFGTATESDIDRQNQIILELQKSTAGALDTLAVHTDKLASFMALSNDRLAQFDKMLAAQQTEINIVIDQFKRQFMGSQTNEMMLANALNRVVDFSLNLQHLNSFEWALTLAASGILTPELLPAEAIQQAINSLQGIINRLHTPGYLIRTRPVDFYQSNDFYLGLDDPFLHVTIRFPFSPMKVPLTLYQITALPTPLPNQPKQFTRIQNLPAAVAFHPESELFMVFSTLPQIPENHLLNLQQSSLLVLNKTHDSCISAIITYNAQLISKLCSFEFRDNQIEPQVVHVAPATLLLINVPSYTLTCQNGSVTTYTPPPHIELTVPCVCRFASAYGNFATRLVHCTNPDTKPTILYPTNFAVLQRFFQQDDLRSITATSAVQTPIQVLLPNITVVRHQYDEDMANAHRTSLDLDKVVNLTQKDSQVFRSLTDKVLFHIDTASLPIQSSSLAFLSWQNLLLLACSIAILLLTFIVYTLHTRLSVLTLTIGVATQVPQATAQAFLTRNPFNYFDGLTAKPPSNPGLAIEIDYRLPTLDLVLLSLLILAFLIFGLIWYRRNVALHTTFNLLLEIGSINDRVIIDLLSLRHIPEMVDINIVSQMESLIITGLFAPEVHLTWPGLHIHDTFSQITYPLPRALKITWRQAYKLRQLTQQPYYVLLFTYFKRSLQPIKAPSELATIVRPPTTHIRPGLTSPYAYSSLSISQTANVPIDANI